MLSSSSSHRLQVKVSSWRTSASKPDPADLLTSQSVNNQATKKQQRSRDDMRRDRLSVSDMKCGNAAPVLGQPFADSSIRIKEKEKKKPVTCTWA